MTIQRRLWVLLLSSVIFCLIALLNLFRPPSHALTPEFYDWHTRSAFRPVRQDAVSYKSVDQLCSSFPSFLLNSIQPILRTGHGVLDKRIRPQLQSVSACLHHLLIFSDIDEVFEGHDIINVIADINATEVETNQQLEGYRSLRAAVANASAGDIQDAGHEAWEMDKFKFLPAISRAWKMRPERRWYVFFEDDTFLVWDNMFRLLENFNPDVPLYFGSPSPGKSGTWFANGGAGYVISREAMRRLVKYDYDLSTGEYLGTMLTAKHWEDLLADCCGDSLVGWALWNEDVALSGLWPMFNPHPPHSVPFADRYWCQPVISMHKPHADDMIGLWRWQFEYRDVQRPFLYRDLALSYLNMTNLTTRDDWDNAAFDGYPAETSDHYPHDPNSSIESCSRGCEAHPACFQWTYYLRKCTFVTSFRLGMQKYHDTKAVTAKDQWSTEDLRYMSGWATEKIRRWAAERPCAKVQWVTPSKERIF